MTTNRRAAGVLNSTRDKDEGRGEGATHTCDRRNGGKNFPRADESSWTIKKRDKKYTWYLVPLCTKM